MTGRPLASLLVAATFAALLIGLAIVNRSNAARAEASAGWVAHTYAVTAELSQALSALVDAETGERGFLITGEERYLEPYREALQGTQTHITRIAELTRDNPEQREDVARFRALAADKLRELEETLAARRTRGFDAAAGIVATDRGKRTMDALRVIEARMSGRERALLAQRQTGARLNSRRAFWSTVVTTAIALAAVAVVWVGFRRHSLERARTTAAIANEREHLRVTLFGIGDGVIVVDASGVVSMMNPAAEMLTGWRQQDATGKPVSSVFHIVNEDTRREVTNPLAVVLETGTIQGLANHTLLIGADGVERPIDDSAAPIRNEHGTVLGAVLVFRDISARRADERRVRDALEDARASRTLAEARQHDLEQALEVKNQFLAAVSHELRTPINAIVGWASQLHAGTIRPERVGAAVASVDRNARALAQLIEDLLESSRLLTGKVRLSIGDVDVRAIVHDAVDAVRLGAENKRVRIDVDVDHVPPVKGDADRLKQVIWNLLGNAIKFTPPGGSVLVRARADIEAVTLSVSDSGMGIRPAVLPHIFEPFRQADETSQTGLGLGLAIARQLVEMHGGTIQAASDGPGRGSNFVIRIPSGYSERIGAAGSPSQGTTSSLDTL